MEKNHLICTIIAPNYLSQALVLGQSLNQNMPKVAYRILILKDEKDNSSIDALLKTDEYLQGSNSDHSCLSVQDVDWEGFNLLGAVNKYDLLEFATCVKPALIRNLLKEGWDRVTYLDPDIQVFQDFSDLLSDVSPISLTPHILQDFPADLNFPNHKSILLAGTYNLGFISCKANSLDFLNWWASKLENFCTMELQEGYHVDQKWVDWAPGFCETQVLRNPGLNVAYWNLHERSVFIKDECSFVSVGEKVFPLYFYHFSGFDDFENLHISKHSTRIFPDEVLPHYLIKQYVNKRSQWSETLENFDWKFLILHSNWSLGGRLNGFANPIGLRRSLLEKSRNQIKLIKTKNTNSIYDQKSIPPNESLGISALGWLIANHFSRKQVKTISSKERQSILDYGYDERLLKPSLAFADSLLASLPRIKIVGYFAAPTGVGQIARNTASLLQRFGVPFTAECVTTDFDSPKLRKNFFENYSNPNNTEDLTLSFINADMWLTDSITSQKVDRNKQFVSAVWAWEIESIPSYFIQVARDIDQIFALSDFSAQALTKAIGKPVKVFPTYCPEFEFPNRIGASRADLVEAIPQLPSKYVLCRFDAKSVIERKNPEAILEVWRALQNEFPDYSLIVKTTDLTKLADTKLLNSLNSLPRLILIDRELDQEINNSLMIHAGAYISLHRAEGLGLNILEAVFADVPAIFTNYSGLSEELNDIGFKVNYSMTKISGNAHPYPENGDWAEPEVDHAVAQLREALKQVESGLWQDGADSRDKWVQQFLNRNTELAISEIKKLLDSISLVENRFDRYSYQNNFILRKILPKFKVGTMLPLWRKLPIGLRQTLKPYILRLYFGLLKRDANLKHQS